MLKTKLCKRVARIYEKNLTWWNARRTILFACVLYLNIKMPVVLHSMISNVLIYKVQRATSDDFEGVAVIKCTCWTSNITEHTVHIINRVFYHSVYFFLLYLNIECKESNQTYFTYLSVDKCKHIHIAVLGRLKKLLICILYINPLNSSIFWSQCCNF